MDYLLDAAKRFHQGHEKLKRHVHAAWRYPLPPWGRFCMGCFYFSVPVVGGWYVMQWAIGKSHESIGERGEKLKMKQIEGIGDKTIVAGELKKIGAGGKYGGVHLAVSDQEAQARNQAMLEKFFKRQRRKIEEEQSDG